MQNTFHGQCWAPQLKSIHNRIHSHKHIHTHTRTSTHRLIQTLVDIDWISLIALKMANNSQNIDECARTRSNNTTANPSRTRQNAQSTNSRTMTSQTRQSPYYSRQPAPIQPVQRGPNIVSSRPIDNPNFISENYVDYGYDESTFKEPTPCSRCPGRDTRPSPATIRAKPQLTDDRSSCGAARACRPQQVVDQKETSSNKSYGSCVNSSPCNSPERSYAASQTSPRSDWNYSQTTDNCDVCCSEGDYAGQSLSSGEITDDICGRKEYSQEYQPNVIPQNTMPTMEQIYRDEDSVLNAEVIARNFNLEEFLARERSAQARKRELTWHSEYSVDDSSRMNSTMNKSQNSQTLNSSRELSSPRMSSTMKRHRSPIIVVPRQGLNDYVSWRLRACNADRTDSSMQSTMRSPMPKRTPPPQRSKQATDGYSTSYSYMEPSGPSYQSTMREPASYSSVAPSRLDSRRPRGRDATGYESCRDFSPQMNSTMKGPPSSDVVLPCCGNAQNGAMDTFSGPQMSSTMKPAPYGNTSNDTMNSPGPITHSTMRAPMNDTIVMPRSNAPRDGADTTWCADQSVIPACSPPTPGSPGSAGNASGATYDCSRSSSRKCPPVNGENLDPDCVRKMLVSQLDTLVKDSYCPGIIQETVNGCENFNTIAFDLMFGQNGFVPECPPPVEPITLLEAFFVRVDMERVQLNKMKCCRSSKPDDDDEFGLSMIDDYFSKLYDSELNQAISDLLKAETIIEILEEEVSDAPTFTLDMSKGETMLPGGKPVMVTAYTGTTAPKDV